LRSTAAKPPARSTHGDEFKERFDALVKARNVMRTSQLRNKYTEQMLEVLCKVGETFLLSSHSAWVKKYELGVDKQDAAGQKKTVIAI
jgi:hypothetical protein